jgi:tetratricopeptide (TPR) repeat protein
VPEYRFELAGLLNSWGFHLRKSGRPREAAEAFQESLGLRTKLVGEFPGQLVYRRDVAMTHYNLATVYNDTGRTAEAEEAYRKAREIYEKLVVEAPEFTEVHKELANTLNNQGMILRRRGNLAGARPLFEQAIRHQRDALKPAPRLPRYLQDLICYHVNLGDVLVGLGDHAAAAAVAVDLSRIIPTDWEGHTHASCYLMSCAALAAKDTKLPPAERPGRSRAYADQARDMQGEGARRLPDNPGAQNAMARYLVTGEEPWRHDPALAVDLAKKATQRAPEVGGFWNKLGTAHYRAGEWEAAVVALERSMKLGAGGDSSDHFVLAMAHWQLAAKEPARKQTAHEWFRRGTEWLTKNEQALRKNEYDAARLRRLRAEAAAMLGVKEEPTKR